ncbi:hypothetical protein BDEG_22466 [Batrachochytrium dendrobatidis JEL423]|uniref:G-protein coupled receptors family 1 profile domain-containing protein n=1 Tax=Batrachochytrium dendrobatidis (strain JEL423) TaxID=403673 RepID=A0A177WEL6_BATDL|nr:hypothetical protein BDEG_22466 [Batrachochytrium dendrobatidis JEL423]
MPPRIPPEQVLQMGFPTFSAVISVFAFFVGIYGAHKLIQRGRAKRFTPAIIALIVINLLPVLLQVVEAIYLYHSDRLPGFKTWRNWCYSPSLLLLNLVQLEIMSIFNSSFFRWKVFRLENMPYVQIVAVIVHLVFAGPTYLEGIVYYNQPNLPFGRWCMYGTMAYSFMVVVFGISQNIFLFNRVQQHMDSLRSNEISGYKTTSLQGNRIRILIVVLIILDITAFTTYVLSVVVGGLKQPGALPGGFALQQCVFAIAGVHQLNNRISRGGNTHRSGGSNAKNVYFGESTDDSKQLSLNELDSPTTPSSASPGLKADRDSSSLKSPDHFRSQHACSV